MCWQTKDGVSGQYMVALLYGKWLCLATAGKFDQIYTIQACIALTNIKVEDVDNGRGMTSCMPSSLSDANGNFQASNATQRGIRGRSCSYQITSCTS